MAREPSPQELKARLDLGHQIGLTDDVDIEECIDIISGGALYINGRGRRFMMDKKFGKGNWSSLTAFPTKEEYEMARIQKGNPPKLAVMWAYVFVRSGHAYMFFRDSGTCMPGSDMPSTHIKWEEKGIEIAGTRAETGAMAKATGQESTMLNSEYSPGDGFGMAIGGPEALHDWLAYLFGNSGIKPQSRKTGGPVVATAATTSAPPEPIRPLTTKAPEKTNGQPERSSAPTPQSSAPPRDDNVAVLKKEIEETLLPRLEKLVGEHKDTELAAQLVGTKQMLLGKNAKRLPTAENLEACLDHFLGEVGPELMRMGGALREYEEAHKASPASN